MKNSFKLILMLYAIKHDFFSYNSKVKSIRGKYRVTIDNESKTLTSHELVEEFNNLDISQKKDILYNYCEEKF